MFAVLNRCRNLMLPVDLQLQLFDSIILPILLYGAEVWGPFQNIIINRLQLKFYKLVLGVKQRTPSCMVYGELGKYPVDVSIQCRVLVYWAKVINQKSDKFSNIIYRLLHALHRKEIYSSR